MRGVLDGALAGSSNAASTSFAPFLVNRTDPSTGHVLGPDGEDGETQQQQQGGGDHAMGDDTKQYLNLTSYHPPMLGPTQASPSNVGGMNGRGGGGVLNQEEDDSLFHAFLHDGNGDMYAWV